MIRSAQFLRRFLTNEQVNPDFIPVKSGRRTGMAVVGVQPPDRFPLLFYRENPADIHLTIEEAKGLPLAETPRAVLVGDGFEPRRRPRCEPLSGGGSKVAGNHNVH